jgi:hypothetical protein
MKSRASNVQKDGTVMALQNSFAPMVTFVKVKEQERHVLLARMVMLKRNPRIQLAKNVSLARTIVFQDRLLVQIVVLLENSILKKQVPSLQRKPVMIVQQDRTVKLVLVYFAQKVRTTISLSDNQTVTAEDVEETSTTKTLEQTVLQCVNPVVLI